MRFLAYIMALGLLVAAVGAASEGAHARAGLHLVVAIALAWISCCEGDP